MLSSSTRILIIDIVHEFYTLADQYNNNLGPWNSPKYNHAIDALDWYKRPETATVVPYVLVNHLRMVPLAKMAGLLTIGPDSWEHKPDFCKTCAPPETPPPWKTPLLLDLSPVAAQYKKLCTEEKPAPPLNKIPLGWSTRLTGEPVGPYDSSTEESESTNADSSSIDEEEWGTQATMVDPLIPSDPRLSSSQQQAHRHRQRMEDWVSSSSSGGYDDEEEVGDEEDVGDDEEVGDEEGDTEEECRDERIRFMSEGGEREKRKRYMSLEYARLAMGVLEDSGRNFAIPPSSMEVNPRPRQHHTHSLELDFGVYVDTDDVVVRPIKRARWSQHNPKGLRAPPGLSADASAEFADVEVSVKTIPLHVAHHY